MDPNLSFTAYDVLTIAITIEADGEEFYTKAAAKMPGTDLEKVLLELARQEGAHRLSYEVMRDDVMTLWGEDELDFDNETSGFLQLYANGEVFNDQEAHRLLDEINVEGIIRFAIECEYRNIAFLAAIRESVSQDMGKGWVSKIIKEELGHVELLGKVLKKI